MTLAGTAEDPHLTQMLAELETMRDANKRLRQEIADLHAVLEARPQRALEPLNAGEKALRDRDLEIVRLQRRCGLVGQMTIAGRA